MDDFISRQAAIDALDCINGVEEVLRSLPPAQPHTYRGVTLNDVMMYFDSLEGNEDAWTELCSCFECRGWKLIRIQDGDARQNFLDIVYAELADDPDNNRANKIIEAADEYAESAQLGTDCISRQAAIDALRDATFDFEACEIVLRMLPSAQPEQRIGKWVFKNDLATIPTGYYECSECKIGRLMYKENFCPNCGAKMGGDAE